MTIYPQSWEAPMSQFSRDRRTYKARLARLCIEAPAQSEKVEIDIASGATPKERYTVVGKAIFKDYAQRLGDDAEFPLISNGSLNGCIVIATMLQHAPEAYITFCEKEGLAPSLEGISTALKDSKALPHFFAAMDAGKNSMYEKAFGLNPNFDSTFNNLPPFIFTKNEHDPCRYVPNPEILEGKFKVVPVYRTTTTESDEYCPTRGAFLTETWNTAIEICTQHPALFAHDLSTHNSVQ